MSGSDGTRRSDGAPALPRHLRLAILLAGLATVAAVAARLFLDGEIDRNGQDSAGTWAVVPAILAALATASLLLHAYRGSRTAAVGARAMAALLAVFCFSTGFSIGVVFLPALALLVAAIVFAAPPGS